MSIIIGRIYKLPNTKLAFTYGCNDLSKEISYRVEGEDGAKVATYEEVSQWEITDLKYFPSEHAKDPFLPYAFDLFWDIKRMSELEKFYQTANNEDKKYILGYLKDNKIVIPSINPKEE